MTTHSLSPIVQHLHRFAARPQDRSDDDLLRAFTTSRDEAAFTAIVKRYGRLVLGICRRTLGHEQDAEDVFQATFLVLARNAAAIRKGHSLASWLHGVCYRLALKARQQRGRRRNVRVGRPETELPADEVTWNEVRTIVDEEIARLPELYRAPFLLCCMQGASRTEAAEQLGIKDGTLSSRLAHGKKRLQEALARRGIECGSALVPLSEFVPMKLVKLTVACASSSDGGATIPAAVANLVRGTASVVSWGHSVAVVAVLLTLAALVGTAGFSSPQPAKPVAVAVEEGERVEVKGRVIDPTAEPVAGASVSVFVPSQPDRERLPLATTDKEGRFSLSIPSKDTKDAKLVAIAKGFAAEWGDLAPDKDVTLTLRDDVPLRGRLLNLEGQPLEGVTVQVSWVGQHREDKLGDWIKYHVDQRQKGSYVNETGLRLIRPQALGVPRTATTDKDGRFRLTGIGRDRVVTLYLRGDHVVHTRLQVATREGPKTGWTKGDHGLYPTEFSYLLAPSKPIVGVVRDRKTGQPIAGIIVKHNNARTETKTNAKGEFRLVGGPKRSSYTISLGGSKGVPYLNYTPGEIADTPGLDPVRVDVEMDRGVEITGKVLDKATGQPVAGEVMYLYRIDNPHRKDYPTLERGGFRVGEWGEIGPDGSFTVLGIRGGANLAVVAKNATGYVSIDAKTQLFQMKSQGCPVETTHAAVAIDVDETNPKSLAYQIHLTPATSRVGRIVDPDGKPVAGAHAVGQRNSEQAVQLASEAVTMSGMGSGRERALVVLHKQRQLGAVAAVGKGEGPFVVKLQPLATLTGRLVDDEGNALAGKKVRVHLWLDPKKYENLPMEMRITTAFGIVDGAWSSFTSREATTDKDGRFRVTGLIGGERYDLVGGDRDLSSSESVTHLHEGGLRGEAGKVSDVGDLKPRKMNP